MADVERLREPMAAPPDPELWQRRAAEGWKLVAVEWERPVTGEEVAGVRQLEPVPYGLRVAPDCLHLEEDAEEMEVLRRMLVLIGEDLSLSEVAEELNRAGFRDRDGAVWTQVAAFHMLPRLIEAAPEIRSRRAHRRPPAAASSHPGEAAPS